MHLATPSHAIVRPPSSSYAACLREHPDPPIDIPLARTQHAGYVAALRDAGIVVDVLAELPDAPDATFVEDTAIVLDTCALVTRPGARTRRAEVASIAAALEGRRTITIMPPPGTIDGGDVMRIGRHLVVGLSQRTDRAGADALAKVAATDDIRVITVDVPSGLHLKSACSVVTPELVVVHGALGDALRRVLDPSIVLLAVPEPTGANVLGLGDRVLVSSAAPRTAELLVARGLRVHTVELSQIHLGDGALSCLSLRFAPTAEAWCV